MTAGSSSAWSVLLGAPGMGSGSVPPAAAAERDPRHERISAASALTAWSRWRRVIGSVSMLCTASWPCRPLVTVSGRAMAGAAPRAARPLTLTKSPFQAGFLRSRPRQCSGSGATGSPVHVAAPGRGRTRGCRLAARHARAVRRAARCLPGRPEVAVALREDRPACRTERLRRTRPRRAAASAYETPVYVVSLGVHRNSHGPLVLQVCQSRDYRSQQVHAPAYGSVHALEHLPGPRLEPTCSCLRRSQGWRQGSAAQPHGRRISWWERTNRSGPN